MYALSKNIRFKSYDSKHLIFDPFTGSWAFVSDITKERIRIIKCLLEDFKERELDSNAITLLEILYKNGLASKDGKFSWASNKLDHSKNKVNTIILKMVGYCNLACSYCYDFDEERYKLKLSFENAKLAIDGVWETAGETLNILFHGGEPMMAKDVIFKVVEYVNQKKIKENKSISYSIQTNGTLLNDEWVDFFFKHEFKIGLSLDGVGSTNDINRYYHNGKGSYKDILDCINKYPEVKERVGVLTTVTKTNVKYLFEIALELKKLGFKTWKTILYQDGGGRTVDNEDKFTPNPEDVVIEYLKLLDGIESGIFDGFNIQSLKTYISNIASNRRVSMCLRNSCGAANDLISISVNGEIEACDCITNKSYNLGRITSIDSIKVGLQSDAAKNIRSRNVYNLYQCQKCDWRLFCGGTCLAKAGEVSKVDATECMLSINVFNSIFSSLSKSNNLLKYV
ncbi:radical SAM protein [Mucilaginibacter sp. R-33]|uniref:radical SAM protein n=1 Tax=unclassified Mucilaginibacter TaxID=2617802 RepID=UPI003CF0787F